MVRTQGGAERAEFWRHLPAATAQQHIESYARIRERPPSFTATSVHSDVVDCERVLPCLKSILFTVELLSGATTCSHPPGPPRIHLAHPQQR